MSLEVLQAYVSGYTDHLFDMQVLAVQSGYWAGYYGNAKHPKNPKDILAKMARKREHQPGKPAPDVDVEAYLATEQRFKERMSQ